MAPNHLDSMPHFPYSLSRWLRELDERTSKISMNSNTIQTEVRSEGEEIDHLAQQVGLGHCASLNDNQRRISVHQRYQLFMLIDVRLSRIRKRFNNSNRPSVPFGEPCVKKSRDLVVFALGQRRRYDERPSLNAFDEAKILNTPQPSIQFNNSCQSVHIDMQPPPTNAPGLNNATRPSPITAKPSPNPDGSCGKCFYIINSKTNKKRIYHVYTHEETSSFLLGRIHAQQDAHIWAGAVMLKNIFTSSKKSHYRATDLKSRLASDPGQVMTDLMQVFSRGLATLNLAVAVRQSVRQ